MTSGKEIYNPIFIIIMYTWCVAWNCVRYGLLLLLCPVFLSLSDTTYSMVSIGSVYIHVWSCVVWLTGFVYMYGHVWYG